MTYRSDDGGCSDNRKPTIIAPDAPPTAGWRLAAQNTNAHKNTLADNIVRRAL
jgi:hypothetical protein